MPPVVKDVPVQELLPRLQRPHLVEEEVAQAVVDEGSVYKVKALGLVGLAAADDDGARLGQGAKVGPLLGGGLVLAKLPVLEGSDGDDTLLAQLADLGVEQVIVARGRAGTVGGGPIGGRPRRIAADKAKGVHAVGERQRCLRLRQVPSPAKVGDIALVVHRQRKFHRLHPPVEQVVAGQFDRVHIYVL